MPALSALIKGAFYDNDCLQAAWDLVKGWSWDERMEVYLDSHRDALAARVPPLFASRSRQGTLRDRLGGTARQKSVNDLGDDETIYLKAAERRFCFKANVRPMSCWKNGRASCTTTSRA